MLEEGLTSASPLTKQAEHQFGDRASERHHAGKFFIAKEVAMSEVSPRAVKGSIWQGRIMKENMARVFPRSCNHDSSRVLQTASEEKSKALRFHVRLKYERPLERREVLE